MRRTFWAGLALVLLAVTACGAGSPGGTDSSPQPTRAKSLMVIVTWDAAPSATIRLIDDTGRVAATAQFTPPPRPGYSSCASIIQPPVRVAAGAVYFSDNTGVVRKLARDGTVSTVVTFKLSNSQQALSFAVSPDGRQLIAIVLSTPALHDPPPKQLGDPYFGPGTWTLDLETAVEGGATKMELHKDLGTAFPQPTVITGWDVVGPTATLQTRICTQNVIPSVRYTGTLIHLASDGTHLERIGGGDCQAWDELTDGTVLCGGSDWQSFSVRRRSGEVLWSGAGDILDDAKLSPDGNAVASADGAVYLRYPVDTASYARHAAPQSLIAGWAGPDSVVVLRDDGRIGVAPVRDLTMFRDLGLSVSRFCPACGFNEVMALGSIPSA